MRQLFLVGCDLHDVLPQQELLQDVLRAWRPVPLAGESTSPGQVVAAAIVAASGPQTEWTSTISSLRAAAPTLLIICWHPCATEDALARWDAFAAGAQMVTCCPHALATALAQAAQQQQQGAPVVCDWCGLPNLTPAGYWRHQQLHHAHEPNRAGDCQLCALEHPGQPAPRVGNLAQHLHDDHDPEGRPPEHRTHVYALVVVRRPSDGRFLMTQECASWGFWVPGGGVDEGESLVEGAVRECREEAGVDVRINGILALQKGGGPTASAWRRIIFSAEPAAEGGGGGGGGGAGGGASCRCCSPNWTCKSLPDWESAGACWVDAGDLQRLPLRHAAEPCTWFPLLAGDRAELLRRAPLCETLELPPEWQAAFKGFPLTR